MRHLTYVLRFVGRAAPVGKAGGAWRISMIAPRAALQVFDVDRCSSAFSPRIEAGASVEFEVVFTAEQTFLGFGALRVGETDWLHLATLGSGYLGPSAEPNAQEGAVIWRIDGGEGQFAGASGLIAATFCVDEVWRVIDHQVGVLALP